MSDVPAQVTAAIEAFGRGEIVVVVDDDDRENEGDLFVAASLCTADKMAFIIRHTSGIVCAPLTPEEARRLQAAGRCRKGRLLAFMRIDRHHEPLCNDGGSRHPGREMADVTLDAQGGVPDLDSKP